MTLQFINNFSKGLNSAIGAGDLTVTLNADYSSLIPALSGANPMKIVGRNIPLSQFEVMLATAHAVVLGKSQFTVTRAQEGTTALAFAVPDTTIEVCDTAQTLGGFLQSANNLSDLASAATARTNLGLGTLATQSGTFSGTHSGTSSGTNTGDQTITLTGDVTGSGTGSFAATIASTAITGKTAVTADGADYVLISDTSDSGNLKKALVSDLSGGGGSPGGVDTQVQYNNGGAFGGMAGVTWDDGGLVLATASTVTFSPLGGGADSVKIGTSATASMVDSIAVGRSASATGASSVAVGRQSSSSASNAVSVGKLATSLGIDSVSVGGDSDANNTGCVAIGSGAVAESTIDPGYDATIQGAATAIGYGVQALGYESIAIGGSRLYGRATCTSNSREGIAIGRGAIAGSGSATASALALGSSADATASYATAIQNSAQATATDATAIGQGAEATATDAIAIGRATTSTHADAIVIGRSAASTAANTIRLGGSNQSYVIVRAAASAPADATLANGTVAMWLDETPAAEKLMFKVKLSSGTVKTGTVALV